MPYTFGAARLAGLAAALVLVIGTAGVLPERADAATHSIPTGAFAFELEVVVPATPERAFDAFTRETLSWWDHHFSENPKKLYFETRPGGGFVEIFDKAGNGAWHATVITVDRPKHLRFVGPLGLAGNAIEMTHTLDFEPVETGTRVKLALHAAGEVQESWPATVEGVWKHFLVERFLPYVVAHPK